MTAKCLVLNGTSISTFPASPQVPKVQGTPSEVGQKERKSRGREGALTILSSGNGTGKTLTKNTPIPLVPIPAATSAKWAQ